MLVRDRHRRLARERELPGQQLVGHDPQRVEVAPRIRGLAADLLGGQVLHGPGDGAGLRHAAVRVGPREAEVGDLHDPVLRDEEVLGLHVAMDEPLVMRVSEREERLAEDLGGLRRLHPSLLVQEVPDARAPHVLHDHVVDAVDGAPVVDGDDVGVREAGGGAGLAPEPVDERGIACEGAMEHLDRDLARQDGVVGAEDLAHALRRRCVPPCGNGRRG